MTSTCKTKSDCSALQDADPSNTYVCADFDSKITKPNQATVEVKGMTCIQKTLCGTS